MELERHLDGIETRLRRYAEQLAKRSDIGKRLKLINATADAVSAAAARIRMLESAIRHHNYDKSPDEISRDKARAMIQEEIDKTP